MTGFGRLDVAVSVSRCMRASVCICMVPTLDDIYGSILFLAPYISSILFNQQHIAAFVKSPTFITSS